MHTEHDDFESRCAAVLARLDLRAPFDLDRLRDSVGRLRGRPLHLAPLPPGAAEQARLCGLWVGLPTADVVFYEAGTSAVHRTHIVLHELAHMLLDHGGSDGLAEQLFPDLDPGAVRAVLARGRTDYSAAEEREAELLATLIGRQGRARTVQSPAATARAADVLSRLWDALGARSPR